MTKQGSSNYMSENVFLVNLMKKYQNKERLIPYYKLLNTSLFHLASFTKYHILIWNVFYMLFAYAMYEYNSRYVVFDILCIINVVMLKTFVYFVFKGKVKAYYRQEYKRFHWLLQSYIVVFYGSFFRLPIYIYKNRTKVFEINIFESFANMKIGFITFLVTLLVIYIVFYSQRLITIRDFNNVTIYLNNQGESKESIISVQDNAMYILLDRLSNNKAKSIVKQLDKQTCDSEKNFIYDGDNAAKKLIVDKKTTKKVVNQVVNQNQVEVDDELKRFAPSIRKYLKKEVDEEPNKKPKVKKQSKENKVIDFNNHKKRPS